MTTLIDAKARDSIRTEFGTNFFVEAAAGTGKTTALVGRIVGLVRNGAGSLAQTVSVTYTEKAAGEMKLRLRREIEQARGKAEPQERERLDQALEELELARIGTIHAFCGDLLRERPVEAGVDPLFTIAAQDEARALADEAFEGWMQRVLNDPPEGVRRVLRRREGLETAQEQLRNAMEDLCDHRDFPGPWRRDAFDRNAAIDDLLKQLTEVGTLASTCSREDDYLLQSLTRIALFVREATALEGVCDRDYEGLEAQLRALKRERLWSWRGHPRATFGALSRAEILARRDHAKATLDAFVAASDADLAPLVHGALQGAIAEYQALKAKTGCLDFLDLLIKTRNLVRDNKKVRAELQRRFSHFFVDEFQDTDPLQAEILFLLAADDPSQSDWRSARPIAGKLFLVGDPKQSIYRFRRADVTCYEDVKQRLLSLGADLLHLTTSFRAPPSIQDLVNGAFAPVMTGDAESGEAAYVPLEKSRPEITGQPTIVALPVPAPYDRYGRVSNGAINRSLPEAVGALVDWIVRESGWMTTEQGASVPIRPRHIAILFRRFQSLDTDITRPYVRALEARRIPHVLVGGRSFHNREEVIALRNAITAIEWPDDELKVFATLRGPFFALSDEALLSFRQYLAGDTLIQRRLDPMQRVDALALSAPAREVADALGVLRRLHLQRNERPIAQTISVLLETVRAHAGIALWRNGEQALANCQRLIDMARRFERTTSSFRAFVEEIEADAERADANEALIVEEGTEGVRMMTVFKAKGLEFPAVILADPTCTAYRDVPSRHIDQARHVWLEPLCGSAPIELLEATQVELKRDQAEATRIAYVAATRARDLLIVPTCGDRPIAGWIEVLNPMLYPPGNAGQTSRQAPGCPAFGDDSVRTRGPRAPGPPEVIPVRPGLHFMGADRVPVVWWDPLVLALEVEEQAPLRQRRILQMDPEGAAAAASEQNYRAWKQERESLLESAARPLLTVRTVTSLAHRSAASRSDQEAIDRGAPNVQIQKVERGREERPSGRRFGAFVHALLASVDLNADLAALEALAGATAKTFGATEKEISAAVAAVEGALAHPLLRRAAASNESRRESPILLRLDDGSLAEGTVDLAFREQTADFVGWTVVDFKTDREFETSSSRYVAQIELYVRAINAATTGNSRGILLVV